MLITRVHQFVNNGWNICDAFSKKFNCLSTEGDTHLPSKIVCFSPRKELFFDCLGGPPVRRGPHERNAQTIPYFGKASDALSVTHVQLDL